MEQEIKINLGEAKCDISIKGLSLCRIQNLSALPECVAEQMKRVLLMIGHRPDWAEEIKAKAVDGTLTRSEISPEGTVGFESPYSEQYHLCQH